MARTVNVSGSDAKASENGGFAPLPVGDYIATIVGTTDKAIKSEANKGLPTLDVQFKITESPDETLIGKKYTAFGVPVFPAWKNGKSAFLFYQFFKAVGVEFPKEGESGDVELPENEDLWGEDIGITAKVEKDNQGKDRNNFGFFPASRGLKADAKIASAAADDDEFVL